MHIKACCRARGLDYAQPNSKSFTAVLNEKIETFKSLQKVNIEMRSMLNVYAENILAAARAGALSAFALPMLLDAQVICQGPDIGAQFAEVMCDMLAGYSKVKNLCFWGAAIGDGGLLALADLLQASPKHPPFPPSPFPHTHGHTLTHNAVMLP